MAWVCLGLGFDMNWFHIDIGKIMKTLQRYPCPKNDPTAARQIWKRQVFATLKTASKMPGARPHFSTWLVCRSRARIPGIYFGLRCVIFSAHLLKSVDVLLMTGWHITTLHLETKIAEDQTRYKLVEKRNAKIPIQCENCFCFRHRLLGTDWKTCASTHRLRVRRERERERERER